MWPQEDSWPVVEVERLREVESEWNAQYALHQHKPIIRWFSGTPVFVWIWVYGAYPGSLAAKTPNNDLPCQIGRGKQFQHWFQYRLPVLPQHISHISISPPWNDSLKDNMEHIGNMCFTYLFLNLLRGRPRLRLFVNVQFARISFTHHQDWELFWRPVEILRR